MHEEVPCVFVNADGAEYDGITKLDSSEKIELFCESNFSIGGKWVWLSIIESSEVLALHTRDISAKMIVNGQRDNSLFRAANVDVFVSRWTLETLIDGFIRIADKSVSGFHSLPENVATRVFTIVMNVSGDDSNFLKSVKPLKIHLSPSGQQVVKHQDTSIQV